MTDYAQARANMVENQLRPSRIDDPRLLAAMREIPREAFCPPQLKGAAYGDDGIDLGGGRHLIEPLALAKLAQAAAPQPGEVALVIGCDTGYCAAVLSRLVASPFGHTLQGIRENEARMQALGYHTWRFKIAAFVIAGLFAGLAGLLLAAFNRHVAPEGLYWTVSGQAIIMVLVGGAGSLSGPILGAALVHLLPSYVSSYTERWQTILGFVFIGFVLFAPRGIYGSLRRKPPPNV